MGRNGAWTVDGARVTVHPDVEAMARAAADEAAAVLRAAVDARGVAHAMFATGNSQLAFVGALVHDTTGVPWGDTVVFHMDEYVGIGPDHPAGFQRWIRERIVEPAHPRAAHYVEGLGDSGAACAHYAELLRRHPLDLCCLGIGENGHLAFNDPPVADFADPLDVKVVELDAACRRQQVNEGHFPDLAAGSWPSSPKRGRPSRCAPPWTGRSAPRARRRRCGPSTTPASTWSRHRPACSENETRSADGTPQGWGVRSPLTSKRWWTGSWIMYRPKLATVNAAPSLRRPGRSHCGPLTDSNAAARAAAASTSWLDTVAASCWR
jgi:6-phosphogluconolactonase/glucosamine-6-phosphate isomerase/deaminase